MLTQLKLFYYFYETKVINLKINNSDIDTSEQQQLIYNEID
jgi:hypothetical protein